VQSPSEEGEKILKHLKSEKQTFNHLQAY
jgi:hypothetical protein